ncbi:MAG: FAD-dependent oxidoreductase [Planctomycetota bacterium]|nr:FAD-dependent oxidoreductase [Planctomycetota bacterium]
MKVSVADVLVAGGGAIGLSVAEAAARRGLSVTLLERERVGARASWAGAGMLNCRPWPRTTRGGPDYFDLLLASIRLHEQWAARLLEETDIDVGFRRCGAVELYTPERNDAKGVGQIGRLLEGCAARGVRCQRINAADVKALEPRVAVQDIVAALHLPDDAQIRPPRFARALALSCRQREVVVNEGAAVADVWIEDGQARGVVMSDGTRHGAGSVVMCTGAWTGQFETLRRLAPRIGRIEPVRGQSRCVRAW